MFNFSHLSNVLNEFDKVHPFVRKSIISRLAPVVTRRVKESFKNGIEYGLKKAKRENKV
jgi:hypothetical protein